MQVHHLRYYITICDQHSVNKASIFLNTTPQNVSRILKSIEGELDVLLLERTADGLSLTPEGEEFLQFAKSMVYQFDELTAKFHLRKQQRQKETEIKIISSNAINEIILNKILISFLKKYPDIVVKNTTVINLTDGYNYIKSDPTAIAFLYKHPNNLINENYHFSITTLKHQPAIIMNRNHPLASKKKCTLKELSKYQLVLFANNTYVDTLSYYYMNLHQQNISYLGNIDICYEMVACGDYITTDTLEGFNVRKEDLKNNLVAIPIADLPYINGLLIKSKDLPTDSPQQLLYAFILNYLQEHKDDPIISL